MFCFNWRTYRGPLRTPTSDDFKTIRGPFWIFEKCKFDVCIVSFNLAEVARSIEQRVQINVGKVVLGSCWKQKLLEIKSLTKEINFMRYI